MSIDGQLKEMQLLAKREKLDITETITNGSFTFITKKSYPLEKRKKTRKITQKYY